MDRIAVEADLALVRASGGIQDHAAIRPRTNRPGAGGVGHRLAAAGDNRRVDHIIRLSALEEPRTLLIGRIGHAVAGLVAAVAKGLYGHPHLQRAVVAERRPVRIDFLFRKRDDRDHVFAQLGAEQRRVAPIHIRLAVVVNEHRRVDARPARLVQRLAQRVFKRAVRRIRNAYADAPGPRIGENRRIHVILAVALDHLLRPGRTVYLRPVREGHMPRRRAMVSPVDHVLRREAFVVFHRVAADAVAGLVLVVRSVDIQRIRVIGKDHRRRIGRIPRLHKRVECRCGCHAHTKRHTRRHCA